MTDQTQPQVTQALVEFLEAHHASDVKPLDESAAPGVYLVDRPLGREVKALDLRPFLAFPTQQAGTTVLHTADSFVDWTAEHRTVLGADDLPAADAPLGLPAAPLGPLDVYADVDALSVVAILDPHRPGVTSWEKHRGSLTLRRTPAWKAWCEIDGTTLEQEAFAHFVQDQGSTIAEPPALELQEIAETLQLHVSAKVSSAVRIQNGARHVIFDEAVEGVAGNERTVDIPDTITLRLPMFEGDDAEEILVRLLYRQANGKVRMGIKIVDRADRELQKFHELCAGIGDRLAVTPVFGKAP